MNISRRSFLKLSGATFALASGAGCLQSSPPTKDGHTTYDLVLQHVEIYVDSSEQEQALVDKLRTQLQTPTIVVGNDPRDKKYKFAPVDDTTVLAYTADADAITALLRDDTRASLVGVTSGQYGPPITRREEFITFETSVDPVNVIVKTSSEHAYILYPDTASRPLTRSYGYQGSVVAQTPDGWVPVPATQINNVSVTGATVSISVPRLPSRTESLWITDGAAFTHASGSEYSLTRTSHTDAAYIAAAIKHPFIPAPRFERA